jgi:hypothetical protein
LTEFIGQQQETNELTWRGLGLLKSHALQLQLTLLLLVFDRYQLLASFEIIHCFINAKEIGNPIAYFSRKQKSTEKWQLHSTREKEMGVISPDSSDDFVRDPLLVENGE